MFRLVSCLVAVSCFALVVLGGECLTDSNTNQPASAWDQRLWSYSPKTATAASTSSTLSFTTYNLQSSISSACVSNPQTQASFMLTDFVGNQEVAQNIDTRCNCKMSQIIADVTGKSTRFLMTFPYRTGQYGIGAGTTQVIADTQYYLYNANSEQRALVALKTYPAALGGRALWFISTHLDYTVWAARQAQATQLVAWVRTNIIEKDASASVVVVGDFNGGPDDGYYNIMKGLFKDAWEVYSGSSAGGPTYPANWPAYRFDHIFYYTPSNVQASVQSVEVVNTQASDHRPLRASIKFTVPSSSTPTAAPTAAPTKAATSAPTSAPTAAPTKAATSAPTAAPTVAPTAAPSGSCSASLGWDASTNAVTIRNTGSKAIKTLQITFSPSVPSNNWNWVALGGNVVGIPEWAFQSLGVGQTYASSGYYTSGARPTATVSRISC